MSEIQSRLSNFMPYVLAMTSNTVSRRIADQYEERFGLSISEWRVMAVLGDAGPCTQRDLASIILIDKVAVNRACTALAARGLVSRRPNATDRRSHHLELTAKGREMHGQIMAIALHMEERIFSVLSKEELGAFRCMLDRLREAAASSDCVP